MVLRYPGSKTRKLRILSPYLDWLVQGETEFAEVCDGGGSVLVHMAEKYPHLQLLANDIDPLVAAFWAAVSRQDTMEALCRQLRSVPTHEIRARLLAQEPDALVERAWAAVVLTRTSYSGILTPAMFNGGRDGSRVRLIDNRYNSQHLIQEVRRYHRLLGGRTTVTQVDARIFAGKHRNTPMFVDLPYYEIGHKLYRHAPSPAEHAAVARVIRRCRKALLTYDSCAEVEEMYRGCQVDRIPVRYYAGRNRRRNYAFKEDNEIVIAI